MNMLEHKQDKRAGDTSGDASEKKKKKADSKLGSNTLAVWSFTKLQNLLDCSITPCVWMHTGLHYLISAENHPNLVLP